MIKTKIIVTLGPSTSEYDIIKKILAEDVSGVRINYSHGDKKTWSEWINIVREVSEELDKTVSIIGDIPGPQIRIGDFKPYFVKAKDTVTLFYGEQSSESRKIPVPVRKFFESIDVGDQILLDDGKVLLRIINVTSDEAEAIVLNDTEILPHKKIVVSGKEVDLPFLTQRDVDLIRYSIENNIDYIAVSFVRKASDLDIVKEIISRYNGKQGLIAKIETRSSVNGLNSIIEKADSILIARGDLGLHFSLEKIPLIQERVARKAILSSKPCILATQLLESMTYRPRPSRSEVVDVMNAVYNMVDALLLTNETAVGKYPLETVKWLKKIIEVAENHISNNTVENIRKELDYSDLRDKYALGLTLFAEKINAKILIYTRSGTLPPRISRVRPQIPIYVGTNNEYIARKLSLYYGFKPYYLKQYSDKQLDYEEGVEKLYDYLKEHDMIQYGETIVEAYGRSGAGIYEIKVRHVI